MKLGLHIIQNPAGSFSFVGSVPCALAYVSKDGGAVCPVVVQNEMRLPSKFRTIKARTFTTREDAEQAAKTAGFEVSK